MLLGETAGATERAFASVGETEGAFASLLALGETAGATDKAFLSIIGEFDESFKSILEEISGAAGSLSKAFGSVLGLGGGGGLLGLLGIPALQEGGIVRRPSLILAGERGPEAIVPLSRQQPESEEEKGEVVIINLFDRSQLNAIIAQQMAANKGVLVNDFMQGLRGNQPVRRAGRKFL